MRSARATPAPPGVMVGYSSRLALSTTFTGLFFSVLARSTDWRLPIVLAVPLLAWSGFRLWRTRLVWLDPVQRARVVLADAGVAVWMSTRISGYSRSCQGLQPLTSVRTG